MSEIIDPRRRADSIPPNDFPARRALSTMMADATPRLPGGTRPIEPVSSAALSEALAERGWALAEGQAVKRAFDRYRGPIEDDSDVFAESWASLMLDDHMADGGRYRRRRHAVFSARAGAGELYRQAHQPHFQALDFNRLNGGVARHFAPVEASTLATRAFAFLSHLSLGCAAALHPCAHWHVEMHQFRIEAGAKGAAGLPTPEGAHRDGVDLVMMAMIRRHNVRAGVSQLFDADRKPLTAFTLAERFDLAMVDDRRLYHGVTPIFSELPGRPGFRDLLVLTFRRCD